MLPPCDRSAAGAFLYRQKNTVFSLKIQQKHGTCKFIMKDLQCKKFGQDYGFCHCPFKIYLTIEPSLKSNCLTSLL